MASSSALRSGSRRRREAGPPARVPPPDPELFSSAVSHARQAMLWLALVAAASLFVFADQVNKSAAVFRFIWGEAFRAVLLQKEPSQSGAVRFIHSGRGQGRDEEYSAFVTNEEKFSLGPLAETLAHWLAGPSPTMVIQDSLPLKVDRITFDVSVPALEETLEVTIQKKDVADLYQYGDASAANIAAFSSLYKMPRSDWPNYARLAFDSKCAGKERRDMPGFRTQQTWIGAKQSGKAGVNSVPLTLGHEVQMHDFDYTISLRFRGDGLVPPMILHTAYSLRYKPDPESATFIEPEDVKGSAALVICSDFVPEMRWINGSELVWRDYGRLAPQGPILNFPTADYAPKPDALEKLVEQARAGVASIPTVSDSLPATLVLKLAPWISVFLTVVCSRRIRVLEQSYPGGAKEAFFGRPLGSYPKLSWLDSRALSAIERGARGSVAIAAALAPLAAAIVLADMTYVIWLLSSLGSLPAPGAVLTLARAVINGLAFDAVVFVHLAVALLCSTHLFGMMWRSTRGDGETAAAG